MLYYLDTNILVFILSKQTDEIDSNVWNIIYDYSNIVRTSSVAIQELLLLYRIGKLRYRNYKSEKDILNELERVGVETVLFNKHHLNCYSSLQIVEGHKDMNDHAIIAQSIVDKIPVISSDSKFKEYTRQGLQFIYNKR